MESRDERLISKEIVIVKVGKGDDAKAFPTLFAQLQSMPVRILWYRLFSGADRVDFGAFPFMIGLHCMYKHLPPSPSNDDTLTIPYLMQIFNTSRQRWSW